MSKKWVLVCLSMAGILSAFSQKSTIAAAGEMLQLKEVSYDFGNIAQGRPVTHVFEVTNKGKQPLLLENVQASCGCTTPEWSHQPIPPGGSSPITVGFNAAAEGAFSKTITINYNNDQVKTIVISGNVFRSPATSAALNPSLSLIKQINQ